MPSQQRPDESVIALEYMYPKSFIHRSTMLPRKTPLQELKRKYVILTLYLVSVGFSYVTCHTIQENGVFNVHIEIFCFGNHGMKQMTTKLHIPWIGLKE